MTYEITTVDWKPDKDRHIYWGHSKKDDPDRPGKLLFYYVYRPFDNWDHFILVPDVRDHNR